MRRVTWILLGALLAVSLGAIGASGVGAKLGQQLMTLATALAGERNEDSTTGTDYMAVSEETKCDTVDTATDSTTVYPGPAILSYIYVNTVLSAHTVVISDSATAKFTLPASLAAGSERVPRGAQFRTSLVVDPDNASTGNITVCYRPLDDGVNW